MNESKNYSLIHVEPFEENYLDLGELFTTKFDYVVKKEMYKANNNSLAIYDFFRRLMSEKSDDLKRPIITLSPDPSISSATIAGSSEKFMYTENNNDKPNVKTDVQIIYIDSSPDLSLKKYIEYDDYKNAVLSDTLGLNDESYGSHRINVPSEHIHIIGVNDLCLTDEYNETIKEHNLNIFDLNMMRKKGIAKIIKHIVDNLKYKNVHIVIDLSCLCKKDSPSVLRTVDDGFKLDELKIILNELKELKYIYAIDITGYNFGSIDDKQKHHISNTLTVKTIETIISSFVKLNAQTINFFNDESKFLIWRPLETDDDYGWFILRNMSLDERNEIIKEVPLNEIIIISIPDEDSDEYYDALVTVTSVAEQYEKSYYCTESVMDCCLFPEEKTNMIIDLLNIKSNE